MAKIKIPRPRNPLARAVRDPKGMFRPKTEAKKNKYNRKKDKKVLDF